MEEAAAVPGRAALEEAGRLLGRAAVHYAVYLCGPGFAEGDRLRARAAAILGHYFPTPEEYGWMAAAAEAAGRAVLEELCREGGGGISRRLAEQRFRQQMAELVEIYRL
ncbi:protein of unknown function [Candidatus Hydrogenisulfobacillus filiaventi]|uniref:Uncharacterized protein n=1 Tax=Candidatus Hydrogenisulfobacillus filiaventi TaxID=2707344 RepID=A0A6F8ZIC7_9FIRM|nr:protein of unknown function [Candidatus Hydrogenisulfobacillus filiaventi]